jgi:drug/metabolite transporter (DMT)-like permease
VLLTSLILGRVLSSSGSAALQKRMAAQGLAPTTVFATGIGVLALALAPVIFWRPLSSLPPIFWVYVALAVLLDVPGNILLAKSVHEGELSVVGPLAAYKPAVGLAFAAIWLGEIPSTAGLLGIAIVLSGTLFLAPGGRRAGWGALAALTADPGARWRAISIVLTAIQSVFGKAAINLSSAVDLFLAWTFASAFAAAAIWACLWLRNSSRANPQSQRNARQQLSRAAQQWKSILALGALFLALALLSAMILERMFVGYALALFQLSALLNVALGRTLFAESHAASRAFASLVMVAGAAVLILAG